MARPLAPGFADAPPLGGFFALESPDVVPDDRPAVGMRRGGTELAWGNATSAFAALVAHLAPHAVWLPGYVCDTLTLAVPTSLMHHFPLDQSLSPDLSALDGRLAPGDVVLAVNYFGRAPGPAWRAFVAAHPEAVFVEDCAQAMDTAEPAWGDFRLWSPRKLMGVPEGGLLEPMTEKARAMAPPGPALPPDPEGVAARRAPMQARAEAPCDNARWHPLHQAVERAQAVTDEAMSPEARALLAALDPAPRIAARRRNFRTLAARLGAFALLPETDPAFAPFGFPVSLPADRRAAVLKRLWSARIFPAVHWRDIPAPPGFAADHARAATLVTLPCDHRYGAAEMDRLAAAFLEACA